MQTKVQMENQNVTNSTINSMLDVLNTVLKKDNSLANELLSFLSKHNINVPVLNEQEMKNLIPVSYKHKPSNQVGKLRKSFEGIDTKEYIL